MPSRSSIFLFALASLVIAGCSRQTTPAPARAAAPPRLPDGVLAVYPTNALFLSPAGRQSFVAQWIQKDGVTLDVTTQAVFRVDDHSVARLEKNLLQPLHDGHATLKVQLQGQTAAIPIVVENSATNAALSFRLDVMPVFMKAGCNSGSCHGSSRGKDGFRLSLFGFDPDGDYFRLTREQIGRRVNLADPDDSLVLEKALGHVPHTGGERFTTNSALYATLREWLVRGAPQDDTNVARVVGLEVYPPQMVLESEHGQQQLTVRARYSDGALRDVTPLAVFISNNDVSAKISEDGKIQAGQRGESFVMARFSTFTVGSQVMVVPPGKTEAFAAITENNYIDEKVDAKLRKLRFSPSETCDDSTFIRRLYLDLTGTLPQPAEVRKFLAENSPDKRTHLIDELLQRPEFTDIWAMKWSELLQIRSNNDQFSYKAAWLYYSWLREKIESKTPLNVMVRDLLTATGPTFENAPANYFQVERDTLKTSENVAQVFLGMRIQCSQCHNHPFDRWTMDDYYSFAAFFPQVARKTAEDPREMVIYDKTDGDVKHPVGGRTMKPKFLGGEFAPAVKQSRREILAEWLTSPTNRFFANHMANMVWSHFLGKGIVEPVDDVRVSNPASNPELLDALGAKLVDYNYDFRKLVRDICSSQTYQRTSRANDSNRLDDRNFSHAAIRRIGAEVLLDCISAVTETSERFQGLPRGARAVQIADGNVNNYFLTTFGRATRGTVCTCEVKTEPNLSQALHLLNGNTANDKCQSGGVVKKLLQEKKSPDDVIDDLYLRCLARLPDPMERTRLKAFVTPDKKTDVVLNDLFWALLNSKEFIFNH